jgi:ADP-heptose:LPS heptosyltransferase
LASLLPGGLGLLLHAWRAIRRRVRPASQSRTVVILEPFGMGDVISLEPLVRTLTRRDFAVVLCARQAWQPLLAGAYPLTWLDARVPWATYDDRRKYVFSAYTAPPFRAFAAALRRVGRGALGLDPRGDIRSVLLLHWAGCDRVFTLSHYAGYDLRMFPGAATIVPLALDRPRWENDLALAEALLGERRLDRTPPCLPHLARREQASGSRGLGLVAVAPWEGRLWEPAKWQELQARLREEGWEPLGLCGPGQEELARSQLGPEAPLRPCGTIEAWAEQINRLALVVALDSGPMHLADALGCPVVGLFGPGQLPLWAPSGPRSRVIVHREDGLGAALHQAAVNLPLGRRQMQRITVAEVLAAVRALTSSSSAAPA